MARPSFEKIDVSIDTVLPELPAAEDLIKMPNQDLFKKKMRDLDQAAENKKMTLEQSRYNKRQVFEGGKV